MPSNKGVSRRGLLGAGIAGLGAGGLVSTLPALATQGTGNQIAQATGAGTYVPKLNETQYVFQIEETELNPDGEKSMPSITVNGQYPGTEIRLKEGDRFRALVENKMEGEETSIHWHGLLLPSVMDGVPDVSHEAIKSKRLQLFEYPILQSGTYWYHSHTGLQEQVGFAGPYIIEPKRETLQYDREYVVFLTDWLHRSPEEVLEELREGEEGPMVMGGVHLADVTYDAFLMNGKGNNDPWTCQAKPGDRVRFRIIGAGASTIFRFMVDDHRLTVTHADGPAVQPVEVDNLLVGMGETYDVVVTVKESGSYTIRAMAHDNSGQAIGVLHTPDVKAKADLSEPNWGPKALSYSDLRAVEPTTLPDGPVREISMELTGDRAKYLWAIDGQFYPDAEPYLIRQGERVRVRMKNSSRMFHPMHLHGHFFRPILADGDQDFLPLKHTINIEPMKTLTFEFIADNPGDWIFHCHNLYHLEAGMARVFIYEV